MLLYLPAIFACRSPVAERYTEINGETMGTYYLVRYKSDIDLREEIEKELIRLNNELSTYIPTSTISRFNQSGTGIIIDKTDMYINLLKALEIHELSGGLYDPTVMPLVNYWGFGYTGKHKIDQPDKVKIGELLKITGLKLISILPKDKDSIYIYKPNKDIQLDFSSISKGYGVDKIAELIASKGITDYLVDIGGEVFASGLSPRDQEWVIGVNMPLEDASPQDYVVTVPISGRGLATSGNYRNFIGEGKSKYSHTLNPITGYPEVSSLLSATIIADDCMTADAIATACMASGLERSIEMIKSAGNIEACLIWIDENEMMQIYATDGIKDKLK
jgi:thiamine biosynthesis lipoprotein